MRVYNGMDVAPQFVHRAMHLDLGGAVSVAFHLAPVQIHDQHVLWTHHAFAHAGGCAQDSLWTDAHADVAIICRDPALLVHQFPDVHDRICDLGIKRH